MLYPKTIKIVGYLAVVQLLVAAGCSTDSRIVSGRVEARRVLVAAEMSGRLTALHVSEGEAVEAGALLAELDCDVPRAQRAQAEAQRDVARAQLALIEAGARPQELEVARAELAIAEEQYAIARRGATREQREQLEAALAGLEARLDLARRTLTRAESLEAAGSSPGASADQARTEVAVLEAEVQRMQAQIAEAQRGARREDRQAAQQRVEQLGQRVALLEAGARSQELEAAAAQLRIAEATLTLADEGVERCRLLAPVAGQIDIVDYEVGELVPLGSPLFALALSELPEIRSYAPQSDLAELREGDHLLVRLDGQADQQLEAVVRRIYDEAEFTTGNVQTPADRLLLVFRMDLDIIDPGDAVVRPGMTVSVDLASRSRP